VKHSLAYGDDAKSLFSKYITTGKSGPESRMNKLHDAIDKIPDTDRREALLFDFAGVLDSSQLVAQALLHEENAVSLFSAYVSSSSEGQGAALDMLSSEITNLGSQCESILEPVLGSVTEDIAEVKALEVSGLLVDGPGFSAKFDQMSSENKLSDQEGLAQFKKDFSRGGKVDGFPGISCNELMSKLNTVEGAFVARFATQQTIAALLTDGSLIAKNANVPLEGSGFVLMGRSQRSEDVSYRISLDDEVGVRVSISAAIALAREGMSEMSPIPLCVATITMAMGDPSVNVSFSPYTA
jgi:hypothetical protein